MTQNYVAGEPRLDQILQDVGSRLSRLEGVRGRPVMQDYAEDTGSPNIYIVDHDPPYTEDQIVPGLRLRVLTANASTGPSVIYINGLGPYSLVKNVDDAIAADDIPADTVITLDAVMGTSGLVFHLAGPQSAEAIFDLVGSMVTGNTETGIAVTYQDADSTLDFVIDADLQDLITRWTPASASGPATLQFAEDTDNGTNKITVSAPASLGSDFTVTLPAATLTLIGGSTGSVDNAFLRADGTGTFTVQAGATGATLDDSGGGTFVALTATGAFTSLGIDDNASAVVETLDSSGNAIFGYTSAVTVVNQTITPRFQVHSNTASVGHLLAQWNATDAASSGFFFAKSGSSTIGTQAAVVSGEVLGFQNWQGSDGDEFQTAASIVGLADGAVSDGVVPGKLSLRTANTSGTNTERMFVDSAGLVQFQTDRGLRFNNQTSAAGASTATFTNAPAAGNPIFYLKINIDGTNGAIPVLAG